MSISSMVEPEPEVPTTNTQEVPTTNTQEVPVTEVKSPVGKTDALLDAILKTLKPAKETAGHLKMLIYGPSGHGKTVFMGSAPDNIIVDVEDGLISLKNHPDLVKDSVVVYPYKDFGRLENLIAKFMEQPEELSHIKTFSIDSISELHKRGLAETVEREWKKSPTLTNRYAAETEHQTENNEHIRRLVSSLRDLPMNLILTAHPRTIEPKNKPAKTFPDFSEKLANTIAGIVDIVGYMEIKEVEGNNVRVLRLHSNGTIAAKTRIGGFPEELINPTWDHVYSIFAQNEKQSN